MKKLIAMIALCGVCLAGEAAQTTYTFTSKAWASKVGTTVTDGTTDGWTSIQEGLDYYTGRETPQGLNTQGVHITTTVTGASAESVFSFTEVRKLVLNYCTNNKKGSGTVVFWVGENDSVVATITAPTDNGGLNRDIAIDLPSAQSGKIRFKVNCEQNAIYINTLTIKASNASPSVGGLTKSTFQLVTDVAQLTDSSEVMLGVSDATQNYVMGVFDESVSKNNIHAVSASYSSDRNTVNEVASAVYTLRVSAADDGTKSYTLQDYTDWYIVASGGNPNNSNNNYLTAWDLADSPSYGRYGYWSITIGDGGAATLLNEGSSRSNLLQFNANGGTPIFACYQDASKTSVAIYKRVSVPSEGEPYIQPTFVNCGTALLTGTTVTGSTSVTVNAINLSAEIGATLKDGTVFSLSKSELDRDGDELEVSYSASAEGVYKDTIVLTSGSTSVEVPVLLHVNRLLTIAEAKQLDDQTSCYLQEVRVTKKYNKYIFVEDETGWMMLFDGSNLYGKDLKNGHRLTGVTGKVQDYYGNPTLTLSAAFSSTKGDVVEPTEVEALTDADACRYVLIRNTVFDSESQCKVGESYYPMSSMLGDVPEVTAGDHYDVAAIVYNYNGLVLCPVSVTPTQTAVEDVVLTEQLQLRDGVLLNPNGLSLRVYSLQGALVVSACSDVDMSGWASGTYLVQAEGVATLKIQL